MYRHTSIVIRFILLIDFLGHFSCQTSSSSEMMAVCQEILRNISMINDKIASIGKRLTKIELHILRKVDLKDFEISVIKDD